MRCILFFFVLIFPTMSSLVPNGFDFRVPHPLRHRYARQLAMEARRAKSSPGSQSLTAPAELDPVVKPANLPAVGWVLLNPATDMLPRFPEYEEAVFNCQGGVPIYLDGTTVKAVVLNVTTGVLSVADTTAWEDSDWNTQAEAWLTGGDNHNRYMALNWDSNEYKVAPTFGGFVYSSWSNVITSISGTTINSGSYSTSTPKQFTIALRWAPPADIQDVKTKVHYTADDVWVWGGFVRKTADGATKDIRHMAEYGDPIELDRVYDAKDSAMESRRWYSLGYEDEDVLAHRVRRGTFNAYQATLAYFQPVGALAVAADPATYIIGLADCAPPERSINWFSACAGVAMLLAVALLLATAGPKMQDLLQAPGMWLLFVIGGTAAVAGLWGDLDAPRP